MSNYLKFSLHQEQHCFVSDRKQTFRNYIDPANNGGLKVASCPSFICVLKIVFNKKNVSCSFYF